MIFPRYLGAASTMYCFFHYRGFFLFFFLQITHSHNKPISNKAIFFKTSSQFSTVQRYKLRAFEVPLLFHLLIYRVSQQKAAQVLFTFTHMSPQAFVRRETDQWRQFLLQKKLQGCIMLSIYMTIRPSAICSKKSLGIINIFQLYLYSATA